MRVAIRSGGAAVVLAALTVPGALAQDVQVTSYAGPGGDKVLRVEFFAPVRAYEVWRTLTTSEGLVRWLAPVAEIDLRTGGSISTHINPDGKIGTPGTRRRTILNVLDRELITFRVELDSSYPERIRAQSGNLQEIVQVFDVGDGRSRVVSSMIGWGKGMAWDQILERYRDENVRTYRSLLSALTPRREDPS